MQRCPKCKLLNPDSAVMCDCGHPFDVGASERARAAGFVPRRESNPPGPSTAIKVVAGIVGYFLGALGPTIVAEYLGASGRGGRALFQGLAIVLGLVGLFVALRLARRKRPAARF